MNRANQRRQFDIETGVITESWPSRSTNRASTPESGLNCFAAKSGHPSRSFCLIKIRSIEAMRAAALLLVILFHVQTVFGAQDGFLPFNDLFSAGHRGVDLFFVISGFITAYVHSEDLGRPHRLNNYIFNRAARI